eukprot:Hpha_TRINITY_DN16212_c2_g1::TRINITY_DN16212_c2_g1_i3::g.13102::m.13102
MRNADVRCVEPARDKAVVVAMALPVDANKAKLKREVERVLDCFVTAELSHWDRASVLFEVTPPRLPHRQKLPITDPKCYLMRSEKPGLRPPPECSTINFRAYVMDPSQDYCGTEEEIELVERLLAGDWQINGISTKAKSVQQLSFLVEEVSGVEWTTVRCPARPYQVAQLFVDRRRLRAQLFIEYQSTADAARALDAIEGHVACIDGYRIVCRADYYESGWQARGDLAR